MEKFNFLNQIKNLIDLYDQQRRITGENFNIFSIMSMESDEVFTHSALITELLDPNGSHGLGQVPLELFIQEVFPDQFEFSCENAISKKEFHIGKIDKDYESGGRIDIIVREKSANDDSDKIILIENKIYANEQKNQLVRYSTKYKNAKLLFLTLTGYKSSQHDEIDFPYIAISYKLHILNWLSACVKHAYDKPMVREVLNQYIYLIKKITNQTTNKKMEKDIIEIIKSNFIAAQEINKNFDKAVENIKKDFLKKLIEVLEIESPNLKFSLSRFMDKEDCIKIDLDDNKLSKVELIFRFNRWDEATLSIIDFKEKYKEIPSEFGSVENIVRHAYSRQIRTNYFFVIEGKITGDKLFFSNNEGQSRIKHYSNTIKHVVDILKLK